MYPFLLQPNPIVSVIDEIYRSEVVELVADEYLQIY